MQLCHIALLCAAAALHCTFASNAAAVPETSHTDHSGDGIEDLLRQFEATFFQTGTADMPSAVAIELDAQIASSTLAQTMQPDETHTEQSATSTSGSVHPVDKTSAVSNPTFDQAETFTVNQSIAVNKLPFTSEKAYFVYMIFKELCSNSAVTDAQVASALKRLSVNASDVFAFKGEILCSPVEPLTRLSDKLIPATMTCLSILATGAKPGEQCTCAAVITRRLIDNNDLESLGAWIKVPGALYPGHILYAVRHASKALSALVEHTDKRVIDLARNFIFPNETLSSVGVETSRLLHQHLPEKIGYVKMIKSLSVDNTVAGTVLQFAQSNTWTVIPKRLFVTGSNEHTVIDLGYVIRYLPAFFEDHFLINEYIDFVADIGTDGTFSVTDALVARLLSCWGMYSRLSRNMIANGIHNAKMDFDLSTTFDDVPTLQTAAAGVFASQRMKKSATPSRTMQSYNLLLEDPIVQKLFQIGPRAALLYDVMKTFAFEGGVLPWGLSVHSKTNQVLTCALQYSFARAQASGQLPESASIPAHCMAQEHGLSDRPLAEQLATHQAEMLVPEYVLQTLVVAIRYAQPAIVQEAVDSVVRNSTLFVGFFNRHAEEVREAMAAARDARINEWNLRDVRLCRLRAIETILSAHVSMDSD